MTTYNPALGAALDRKVTSNPHYLAGRSARKRGFTTKGADRMGWTAKHFWLAGWNDADIEMGRVA